MCGASSTTDCDYSSRRDRSERAYSGSLLTTRAGQDIVYAGWAGLEGMLRIIGEKEAELRERFTPAFIGQMKAYDDRGVQSVKGAVTDTMGVSVATSGISWRNTGVAVGFGEGYRA